MTIALLTAFWLVMAGISAALNLPKAKTRGEGLAVFGLSLTIPFILIIMHRIEKSIDKHSK